MIDKPSWLLVQVNFVEVVTITSDLCLAHSGPSTALE